MTAVDITEKQKLLDLWQFPWPVMEVFVGGKSSIDLPQLHVRDFDEATEFLRAYGFDPENAEDLRKMHAVIVESLAFIEKYLMPLEWRRGKKPPREIMYCEDPRQLLLWASSPIPDHREHMAWSCAILRVAHTIVHIEGVHRLIDIDVARDQIMGRIQTHVFRDDHGDLWLGDQREQVHLLKVEWKLQKSRDSIILKLLHKQANVAETIYDFLGVRIITKRLCDVMLVVKFLRRFHMVTFPNCVPARSRNTLVDFERFRVQIEALREMLLVGSLTPEEFDSMLNRLKGKVEQTPTSNPHTAKTYRSIQLTCRQLIRTRHPQYAWLDRLDRSSECGTLTLEGRKLVEEVAEAIRSGTEADQEREQRAFFPFEVQIMDEEAYQHIIKGEASHYRYKRSQIRAARRRALGRVLQLPAL